MSPVLTHEEVEEAIAAGVRNSAELYRRTEVRRGWEHGWDDLGRPMEIDFPFDGPPPEVLRG